MHAHLSAAPQDGAATTRPPVSVFLSWSGLDSQRISKAFGTLLAAVHGDQIDPFHSTNMVGGVPWREELKTAVTRSHVAVLCLVPQSLSSTWLMYEAGAFFAAGHTYLLACGFDSDGLKGTPLDAYQIKDARDKDAVKTLVRLLVAVSGPGGPDLAPRLTAPTFDFDGAFDKAWTVFLRVVDAVHCDQAQARDAVRAAASRRARRIWWLRLSLAPTFLVLLVSGVLCWSSWPRPLCPFVVRATCADYQWENFVARASTAQNPSIAKKISRRPFAVVAVGTSCDTAPGGSQLVSPKDKVTSASMLIPIAFSRSSWDKPDPTTDKQESAIVIGDEAAATLISVATGCREIRGHAIHVRYVGTLSDNKLCEKAKAIEPHFKDGRDLARALTGLLDSFYIPGTAPAQPPPLGEWLAQCGIEPDVRKQATS